ncbi:MAG: DUF3786 domain-containing protein [Bacillota bacterium]
MLEKARADFARADPVYMARWSGAVHHPARGELVLDYCGHPCTVHHPSASMTWGQEKLHPNEEVLVLQYLSEASGLPLRGEWISFLELPGGPHHDYLFRQEAHLPLARAFGAMPLGLREASVPWGAQPATFGDAACVVQAFPRLPLLLIVWGQDEESPARAAVLFDRSAPGYLTTAALYVLGIAVARRVVEGPAAPGSITPQVP